jgi:hypothetical protein
LQVDSLRYRGASPPVARRIIGAHPPQTPLPLPYIRKVDVPVKFILTLFKYLYFSAFFHPPANGRTMATSGGDGYFYAVPEMAIRVDV